MSRRRKTALEVPGSIEDATALVAEYVDAERKALIVRIAAQVMIDGFAQERDAELARLQAVQDGRFLSLKAWWEATGRDLWKGRSTELGGAKIGIRLAPPKVKLPRGTNADAIVGWLRRLRWSRAKEFLRTKVELDKQAIIKASLAEPEIRTKFAANGIEIVQSDEFFIDASLDEDAIAASIEAAE